jgi:hypothetical protein
MSTVNATLEGASYQSSEGAKDKFKVKPVDSHLPSVYLWETSADTQNSLPEFEYP